MASEYTVSQGIQRLLHKESPFPLHPSLVGKKRTDFELVVTRYDEDISWTDHYSEFRTVYNKGGHDVSYAFIPLPNIGHHTDSILRHILDRYDTLATTTFFCHGSINYRADQQISKDLWKSFLTVDPKGIFALRQTGLPKKEGTFGCCKEPISILHERFFGTPYKPLFDWSPGLWISVGRNRIRGRPKEFYQRMLDWTHEPGPEGQPPTQDLYRSRSMYIERFLLKAFESKQ